jgi:hypothetical protein
MNERIKELAGKALDQTMPETWYGISPDDLDRITAKLAELIVRECVQLCQECIDDGCVEAQEPMIKIQKHFGVEE